MRFCKTFPCETMGDRVCCCSCPLVKDCGNPCLNHPSRCGLEDVKRKERIATAPPAPRNDRR